MPPSRDPCASLLLPRPPSRASSATHSFGVITGTELLEREDQQASTAHNLDPYQHFFWRKTADGGGEGKYKASQHFTFLRCSEDSREMGSLALLHGETGT